ncbi:MAG TPA: dTDP-glucose 4,6-dehydratase [Terriglobales bacterium]|nr:dTDP-glucose 4,6-dehydratase [Terriglobales bacterium]
MKILVTGGAGFIGSNFIRQTLHSGKNTEVVNFDKLTYSGNLENLADLAENPRYRFVRGDIADAAKVAEVLANGFDAIVNFAAETHVDRSIENAAPFVHSNVIGTLTLLEAVRQHKTKLFIQISTDEVYGSAGTKDSFTEDQILDPRSPYSASKAAADHLVNAYIHTYGISAITLRCTNNYGPYQFPEKLIPLMIANAIEGKQLPVYGDGMQERDWLYVEDYCRAIAFVLERGKPGDVYNVSSGSPTPNLVVIKTILKMLGKPESLIRFVTDRPGHDRRYSLDSSKLRRELAWKPEVGFEEGIGKTVDWYLKNKVWLERARSGEYRNYYERHYTRREETFSK